MTGAVDMLVLAMVAVGVFFSAVGAVGLLRLPDLYTRAHAVSKSDTLGSGLAIGAVAVSFGAGLPAVKAVLLVVFMLVTNPTAVHAIARAARDQGIQPVDGTAPWEPDEGGDRDAWGD